MKGHHLTLLDGEYAVWKAASGVDSPVTSSGDFLSVTRTPDEVSVVSLVDDVPEDAEVEAGWSCLKVAGPLAFELTGVLASLSGVLANAAIPIFVVSTFDTDYLLVRTQDLARAREALEADGHQVTAEGS